MSVQLSKQKHFLCQKKPTRDILFIQMKMMKQSFLMSQDTGSKAYQEILSASNLKKEGRQN